MSKLNLLKRLITPRFAEYLILDRDFRVLELSPGIQKFADFPYLVSVGDDARLAFPEIIGAEELLGKFCEPQSQQFELEGILREQEQAEKVYFNLYAVCIEEEGSPNHLLLCLEDVTEKMTLRQELLHRHNETELVLQQLRTAKTYTDKILSSMSDPLLITTANGTIKRVNAATEKLLGYSNQELRGQLLDHLVQYPLSERAALVKELEVPCLTKDGLQIMLSLSCATLELPMFDLSPRQLSELGFQPEFDLIYVGRRITSEELASRQLRSLANRLSSLIEHLPQGILLEDQTGNLVIINSQLCQMIGLTAPAPALVDTPSIQATDLWRSRFLAADEFVGSIQSLIAGRRRVLGQRLPLRQGGHWLRDYIPMPIDQYNHGHLWQYHIP
ncbi:MAG: PAS domain S-box protein [Pseudanabaenaceae cyanobacterium bins.68]|nr:PAS domain S-box protein [Pseudanabaenaceae cyanobacterium bins.68]